MLGRVCRGRRGTYSARAEVLGSSGTSKGGNDSEGLHLGGGGGGRWKRM
jgi:hypothetical protein